MQQFLVLTIGRALDPQDGDEGAMAYMGEWQAWLGWPDCQRRAGLRQALGG